MRLRCGAGAKHDRWCWSTRQGRSSPPAGPTSERGRVSIASTSRLDGPDATRPPGCCWVPAAFLVPRLRLESNNMSPLYGGRGSRQTVLFLTWLLGSGRRRGQGPQWRSGRITLFFRSLHRRPAAPARSMPAACRAGPLYEWQAATASSAPGCAAGCLALRRCSVR